MKRAAYILGAVLCMCALSCSKQSEAGVNEVLWYDAPAGVWLEALPLGNSNMGAMVYGGVQKEEIQLNEETFWSGGPLKVRVGDNYYDFDTKAGETVKISL